MPNEPYTVFFYAPGHDVPSAREDFPSWGEAVRAMYSAPDGSEMSISRTESVQTRTRVRDMSQRVSTRPRFW